MSLFRHNKISRICLCYVAASLRFWIWKEDIDLSYAEEYVEWLVFLFQQIIFLKVLLNKKKKEWSKLLLYPYVLDSVKEKLTSCTKTISGLIVHVLMCYFGKLRNLNYQWPKFDVLFLKFFPVKSISKYVKGFLSLNTNCLDIKTKTICKHLKPSKP